ncbi:hypothetical protein MRX96_004163 [Rhipicephalus microplus]
MWVDVLLHKRRLWQGSTDPTEDPCPGLEWRQPDQQCTTMPGLRVRVASKRRCQIGEGPHWDEKAQALLYVDCYAGCVSRLDPETHEDIDTIHFGKCH